MIDHQSLPCRSTDRKVELLALTVVLGMAGLRAVVAATAGLSADEAYYWDWTRPLQLSYFDHPGMVAYWIWAGIHLAGETAFGVRLPAVLGSLVTSALVWDTARLAFASRRAGALAVIWMNCTILFGTAGVIITPDTPLLVFWSLALWALIRLIREERARWLYVAGVALGLGAISKYTMALLLPGAVAGFLLFPQLRPWWKSPHFWLAALLALACTTPLWLWNIAHDFASFHKQLGHAMSQAEVKPLANLGVYLGSQVALVTPLLFPVTIWGMGWGLWAGWRQRKPEWFLLGASSAPILVFFLQHSLGNLVQAHWAGPAYLGGAMAAAGGWLSLERRRFAWAVTAAPVLGACMTLLLFFQASTALIPIPPRIDALKRLGGWEELASAIASERTAHPGVFLFTEKHEPTGPVSFHLPDHPPVFLEGHIRPSYYSAAEVAALKGRDGLYITRTRADGAEGIAKHFTKMTPLRQVTLHWGGRPADSYTLYLAEGYLGGLFVEGDGLDGSMD